MGFYQTILATYGGMAVEKLKLWAKTKIKLAKEYNHKSFLLKCRQLGILPQHIVATTGPVEDLLLRQDTHRAVEYNRRLGSKLLNLEISANHKTVSRLEASLTTLKIDIISLTNEAIFNEFSGRQHNNYNKLFHSIKRKNINKLNNLRNTQIQNSLRTNHTWVKNLTETRIPDDVLQFLSLGPKFCIEPALSKDIPIKNILADVDFITSAITDQNLKKVTIARATNIITNQCQHTLKNNQSSFFKSLYLKAKKFLKDNPDIILTNSDKGNVTVIMNKEQYFQLSNDVINNDTSYTLLPKDPTLSIQRQCNELVKKLHGTGQIDEATKKNLTTYKGISPKFYTLPKIHKPTLSVRPIVASIGAPTELIASYITDILTKSYDYNNEYYIKDSFEVSTLFNNMQLPENHVLVSLDVVSLFSNVYLDAAHRAVSRNWYRISNFCKINKDTFLEIISFLFNNTYFSFDKKFYKQTFGTPMGASVSPILATYVMDDLLDIVLPVLSFKPIFIKKYVDDIILAIPKDSITEIVDTLNDFDQYIQFTIESEDELQSVPFLDTKFIRNSDNIIKIDWYRKPCHSGRYLNYQSYHKQKIKVNLLKQMKMRVLKVSDTSFHNKNLKILYKLFTENSYPPSLVKKILFSTSTTLTHNINNNNTNNTTEAAQPVEDADASNPLTFTSLPYIREITPKLTRLFKPLQNLKIAYRSVLRIGSLHSKVKDRVPVVQRSDVVYSIPCAQCDKIYIGQTTRPLSGRISSHRSDCRLHPERCALAEHANNSLHNIDYNSVKVLATQTNHTKRLFLEMAYISQHTNCMNKRSDIQNLSEIYSYLLSLDNNQLTEDSHDSDLSI